MKRLTFTFDNGPVAGKTDRILDFLSAHAVKATFFLVGQRLLDAQARRLAERAHAEGHWLGNHTFSHGDPLGVDQTPGRAQREIGKTQQLVGALAHPLRFFRPNGRGRLGPHLLSRDALTFLAENKYTVVTWNNVPRDWEEPRAGWVDRAVEELAQTDWSLIVLHDECIGDMMGTLVNFLDRVTDMGVEVVQEFPRACTPLWRGEAVGDLRGLLAPEPNSAMTENSHA